MNKEFVMMERVSFSYGEQEILKNFQLELVKSKSYTMIGKSGTGKSTILNLLGGFMKPTQGEIYINGKNLKEPRINTAYLFQELGLFPWQTVRQAILMPLQIRNTKQIPLHKVNEIMCELKIEHLQDKYPMSLSGGERQRVALARTLIGEPDLLLMDEPTTGLDAMMKEELQLLILDIQKKRKVTMLMVTHDIEEAVMLGSSILILNQQGELIIKENQYYGFSRLKDNLEFYKECMELRKSL